MVAELHALLEAAGIERPVVLVGQSFGGLLVQLYAYSHPEEVAGLVLVDSAHEDQFRRFPAAFQERMGPMRAAQLEQLRGVAALIAAEGPEKVPPLAMAPAAMAAEETERYAWQSRANAGRVQAMLQELEGLETTQEELRLARARPFPDVPLVVVSHGLPAAVPGMPDQALRDYEAAWQQMQAELAALSSQARRLVAERSGHMVHHDQPELVAEAIRQVVMAARDRRGGGR
jgi:pimeloyl-ACP methyl ester carboxylesterase